MSVASRDEPADDESAWAVFAIWFLVVFVGGVGAVAVALLVLDPYDSGRYGSVLKPGVIDSSPRTANASRGRDPRFNAAIFGNSHGQLIDPARLSASSGLQFVQLTVPGSGPREQATLLTWFHRHHEMAAAVVVVIDDFWCTIDASLPLTNPFPFWLYGGEAPYLENLLNLRSIALSGRRLAMSLGWLSRDDPRGYWDYEAGRAWSFAPARPDRNPVDLQPAFDRDRPFPGLGHVFDALGQFAPSTRVVLAMPPIFYAGLPDTGSEAQHALSACKYEVARRVKAMPNAAFVDFLTDTPVARDPKNFMDHDHYRASVARLLEDAIVEALVAQSPRATTSN